MHACALNYDGFEEFQYNNGDFEGVLVSSHGAYVVGIIHRHGYTAHVI